MLDIRIDPNSPVPLYHQIYDQLREAILRGMLQPGERLPTEQELSRKCGVSRMTVRAALTQLTQEGLVERRQGRGTFVAQPKAALRHISLFFVHFTQLIEIMGRQSRTQVVDQGFLAPPQDVAQALHLGPEEDVLHILRLWYTDEVPMALERCYYPRSRVAPFLDAEGRDNAHLAHLLEQNLRVRLSGSEDMLELGIAGPEESGLLKVPEGIPVIKYSRVTFDEENQPFEFVRILVRGDRFRAKVRRMRDGQYPVAQISSRVEGTMV